MTAIRLVSRVERLEQRRDRRHHLTHEEALAVLDADPQPLRDGPGFTDAELDAEWNRLRAEWGERP
jgi:hypothetical protein